MTCQEARAALLMRDVGAIDGDQSFLSHVSECSCCADDFTRIRTATAATAELMNGWSSMADPTALAERSMAQATEWQETRHRRWRLLWVSACAVAISAWVLLASERTASLRAALGLGDPPYTSMVFLQCVSPEAAVEVALPYLHSRGSDARPSVAGVASVTLTGIRGEVAQAEIAIAQVDGRLGAARPATCTK